MRIAICGVWHVHAPQYFELASKYCEITGVWDENEQWRADFAKKYNIPEYKTLDELLSSDELLSAAEENQRFTETHLRELMLGVLDLGMSLLLFLPLFAVRTEGAVQAASLLSLAGMALYLKIAYWIASIGAVILGVLMLALQNCEAPAWRKSGMPLSVLWSVGAVFLFVLGLQPYAAVFALAVWFVELCIWLKKR